MSFILAKVIDIKTEDSVNIVKFSKNNQTLSMMSLELNQNIKIGTNVKLSIKPSHIAIGKEYSGIISYSNQLSCIIKSLDNGKLLCSIELQYFDDTVESIITQESSKKMNLQVGDKVIAFVKASELSISEITNV